MADLAQFKTPPSEACIDACQKLLALAESGELQGMHIAAALTEGRTRVSSAGSFTSPAEEVGLVAMLSLYVSDHVMGRAEEV